MHALGRYSDCTQTYTDHKHYVIPLINALKKCYQHDVICDRSHTCREHTQADAGAEAAVGGICALRSPHARPVGMCKEPR